MKALDERALSGIDFRHSTAEFSALALEVEHRPLQASFATGHSSSGATREVRREGRSSVRTLD